METACGQFEVSTFFLQCLFEAQGQSMRIQPHHLTHPATFNLIDGTPRPLDWYVMGHCIANSFTGSPLKVVIKSSTVLQHFVSGLKTHVPCVGNFQELYILTSQYENTFHSYCLAYPPSTLMTVHLKVLNTGIYKFATESLTCTLDQLIHPSHGKLKTLHIGDVDNYHQDCQSRLCKVLSRNSSLKSLHLNNPCQSCISLFASNSCLTELHIHCWNPSPQALVSKGCSKTPNA